MRIKDHRKFARDLASFLGLDATIAEVGSVLPDLDMVKPLKHRKTLHDAKLAALLLALGRFKPEAEAFAVGYASHMALDWVGADKVEVIGKLAKRFRHLFVFKKLPERKG